METIQLPPGLCVAREHGDDEAGETSALTHHVACAARTVFDEQHRLCSAHFLIIDAQCEARQDDNGFISGKSGIMQRFYTLGEACTLFAIDPVTLRRWMHRDGITPHVDPADHRRRYLDSAQLFALAEAHSRVLEVPASAQESSLASLEQLRVQVAELTQRIEQLENTLLSLLFLVTAAER
jgi:DNA-binding transcriptional MerR regulator